MSDGFDCDYIVVGSGAGGGTVAARLAENGAHVILLEAGGDPRTAGADRFPGDYDIPAFHSFASENPAMAWNFYVEHFADPEQQAKDPKRVPGKGVLYPRAGTLGGCTAHNAMIFVTAQPCDWDQMARLSGEPGWSAASMARYQKTVEACRHREPRRWLSRLGWDPTGHGWDGWLPIEKGTPKQALGDTKLRRLLEVAGINATKGIGTLAAGVERLVRGALDPNDRRSNGAEGLCYAPLANDNHARHGSRERVLDVAGRHPDRLRIELDALVTRVLFAADGGAEGVEYRKGAHLYRADPHPAASEGELRTLRARREVILAGGAFNTPQILMLSGIGPAAELAKHRIALREDLPGVGTNMQDRYEVCVQSKLAGKWESLADVTYQADDKAGQLWAEKRTGIYISNGAALAFKRKSDPALNEADLFIFALLGNFKGYFPGYAQAVGTGPDVISWAILKARTDNRAGTVRLRSADPRDPPDIQFHYFEEGSDSAGRDLRAVAKGIEFVRQVTAPLKDRGMIVGELEPGEGVGGAALEDWVRANAWGHHASCTCPIGAREEGGVLDGRLRVHGVPRLRVVDASIFPRIPGYFIVSAVYMAAERAADMILEDAADVAMQTAPEPATIAAVPAKPMLPPEPQPSTARPTTQWAAAASKSVAADPTDEIKKHVTEQVARRAEILDWWNRQMPDKDGNLQRGEPLSRPPFGLALSGGGIRSATFSLGLLQGLAKADGDKLANVDVLSTVSGGGYIGSFFRSLFVPPSLRGIARQAIPAEPTAGELTGLTPEQVAAAKAPKKALDAAVVDQYRLAIAALASPPDARVVRWAPTGGEASDYRNPVWWLREHSRYLAPSGPTDYSFAVAYIVRNWLAMVFLFVLASAAAASFLVMVEASAWPWFGWQWDWAATIGPDVSPIAGLILLPILVNSVLALAYWATQVMSTNEAKVGRQIGNLAKALGVIVAGMGAAILAVNGLLGEPLLMRPDFADAALDRGLDELFGGGALICVLGAVLAVVSAAYFLVVRQVSALLAAELRLKLTGTLASSMLLMVGIAVLALIDSLGAAFAGWVETATLGTLGSAVLFPALAYLIKKIPDWFGGTGSGGSGMIGTLLSRFASKVALAVGVLLYGLLAVGASALVHHFAWVYPTHPWLSPPRWQSLYILTALVWILAVICGRSTGFINLSSLHTLYSARLVRAFFGASNVQRLDLGKNANHPRPVTENHPGDYIQPSIYGEAPLPAPIHIVNVTLNETVDARSPIVARDRKGDILTVEPSGIRVGTQKLRNWEDLGHTATDAKRARHEKIAPKDRKRRPENISLGQWIAISGAAASSAMGRMSNLGFAVAFTFANVRLGYWWFAPGVCPEAEEGDKTLSWANVRALVWKGGTWPVRTFVYLANEITCRYSKGYTRKYLTDGGHYENSGAYVLIRHRVPLMLVSDNGADPDYKFEDLQTLIRQVRIDLGGETTILGGAALKDFLKREELKIADPSVFVDPAKDKDWQKGMTNPALPAFALALEVRIGADTMHAVWVKPRLLPNLPADVAGYAALMAPFPQQPTGDQFFDEAQWESYRRLGEETMQRLLKACPGLLA